jgi:hypothetical protein
MVLDHDIAYRADGASHLSCRLREAGDRGRCRSDGMVASQG